LQLTFIATDEKTQHILIWYESDRREERTSTREQIVYRSKVESVLVPEDHLFRFEWVPSKNTPLLTDQDDELRRLGIQLLNKEDLTLDQATTREEQWAYYVDSYYMHSNTEGIPAEMLTAPWLRRSLYPNEKLTDPADVNASDLQVKICLNTYKLFYLCDTEDAFLRNTADRTVKPTKWNYNRATRKADGKKWTWEGHMTKEAEDEKAALEAARAQHVVPHPSSIGAPSADQTSESAPGGETAPPAEQPRTDATPAPSVAAMEDGPAAGDVKTETPPLASEPGEAMDIEEPSVAPAPEAPREEKHPTEDVEMADA
jgi:C-terminal domain of Sin3a protein